MTLLRIGLLANGHQPDQQIGVLAHWLRQQPGLHLCLLVVRPAPLPARAGPRAAPAPRRHWGARLLDTIAAGERLLLGRGGTPAGPAQGDADVLTIEALAAIGEAGLRCSAGDLQRVTSLRLDLLIQSDPAPVGAALTRLARLGTIFVDGGADELYRGEPAFFWESYYQRPRTGFTIRARGAGDQCAGVLRRGFFSTKFLYSLNRDALRTKSLPHLQRLLLDIAAGGALPPPLADQPFSGQLRGGPSPAQALAYLGKVVARLVAKLLWRLLGVHKRWQISFLSTSWRQAELCRHIPAPAPRGRYWADPFLLEHEGQTFCFVEDYDCRAGRGHISVLAVGADRVRFVADCLREPFHLSFPFLFRYRGQLYMCPETSAAQQIRVYRCAQFPLRWEPVAVLMEQVAAADTMLFERDGRWWMLTSIDYSGAGDFCSELYAFWADSPLSQQWQPHAANPLLIDPTGGRNAGLIIEGDDIYRLAQKHGYDEYGQGLQAYLITELSETRYAERLVSDIAPAFGPGVLGVHHLNSNGRITVFDHKSRGLFC